MNRFVWPDQAAIVPVAAAVSRTRTAVVPIAIVRPSRCNVALVHVDSDIVDSGKIGDEVTGAASAIEDTVRGPRTDVLRDVFDSEAMASDESLEEAVAGRQGKNRPQVQVVCLPERWRSAIMMGNPRPRFG